MQTPVSENEEEPGIDIAEKENATSQESPDHTTEDIAKCPW